MGSAQISTLNQLGEGSNDPGGSFWKLRRNGGDAGILKPFVGNDGRTYVNKRVFDEKTRLFVNRAYPITTNTPATLPLYAWQEFDAVVERVLRYRLKAIADVRGRGLEKMVPDAMGKTVLTSQTATDLGPATISMDPTRRSEGERQELDVVNFPLPICHKDFDFTERELRVSHSAGVNGVTFGYDTEGVESAAHSVAELLEQVATGVGGSYSFGGGTIYGYTNFPSRYIKIDMTAPDGTNGTTVISNILTLRQALYTNKHRGPFILYVNSQWDAYLDNEFKTNSDKTLRQRILDIADIQDVQTLDYLPTTGAKFDCLLVEMQTRTVRAVVGFDAQTVRWESMGGLMHHYKVMAMVWLQLRADTAGNSGIAHGRTGA